MLYLFFLKNDILTFGALFYYFKQPALSETGEVELQIF